MKCRECDTTLLPPYYSILKCLNTATMNLSVFEGYFDIKIELGVRWNLATKKSIRRICPVAISYHWCCSVSELLFFVMILVCSVTCQYVRSSRDKPWTARCQRRAACSTRAWAPRTSTSGIRRAPEIVCLVQVCEEPSLHICMRLNVYRHVSDNLWVVNSEQSVIWSIAPYT